MSIFYEIEFAKYILPYRSFNRAGMNDAELKKDAMFIRMVADHIGGMTDQFASRTYKKLYYPDYI